MRRIPLSAPFQMDRLSTLPPEILDLILEAISPPSEIDDIKSALLPLALVSHRFRTLVQSIIFRHFDCHKRTLRLRSFALAIISNPTLATHVKYLSLKLWTACNPASDSPQIELEEDDPASYSSVEHHTRNLGILTGGIEAINPHNVAFWQDGIQTGVDEVYVAMILLLLPNVERLKIAVPVKPTFLIRAIDQAFDMRDYQSPRQPPALRSLRELTTSPSDNVSFLPFDYVLPFLKLPCLEHITTDAVHSSSADPPAYSLTVPLPPGASRVTTLSSNSSVLHASTFSYLFETLPTLRSLKYNGHATVYFQRVTQKIPSTLPLPPPEPGSPTGPFRAPDFGHALKILVSRLEDLELRVQPQDADDSIAPSDNTIGSLRSFTRLRTLRISLPLLLGPSPVSYPARLADLLPPALELFEPSDFVADAWRVKSELVAELLEDRAGFDALDVELTTLRRNYHQRILGRDRADFTLTFARLSKASERRRADLRGGRRAP